MNTHPLIPCFHFVPISSSHSFPPITFKALHFFTLFPCLTLWTAVYFITCHPIDTVEPFSTVIPFLHHIHLFPLINLPSISVPSLQPLFLPFGSRLPLQSPIHGRSSLRSSKLVSERSGHGAGSCISNSTLSTVH